MSRLALYKIGTNSKVDLIGPDPRSRIHGRGCGRRARQHIEKGQRVVVPFTISCGSCFHCNKKQYSACDNGNPADNQDIAERAYGRTMGAIWLQPYDGRLFGRQAEYVRVPFSDVRPIVIPDGIDDDKVLFLSDILPTGWMAAENCDIEPGDTVVIIACRKGGRMSMPAVYGGFVDKFPLGALMEKALTLKTGQTHVQRYMAPLLAAIMEDKIDTTFLISHRLPLESAPDGYRMFHDEQDHAMKIVLKPGMN